MLLHPILVRKRKGWPLRFGRPRKKRMDYSRNRGSHLLTVLFLVNQFKEESKNATKKKEGTGGVGANFFLLWEILV